MEIHNPLPAPLSLTGAMLSKCIIKIHKQN